MGYMWPHGAYMVYPCTLHTTVHTLPLPQHQITHNPTKKGFAIVCAKDIIDHVLDQIHSFQGPHGLTNQIILFTSHFIVVVQQQVLQFDHMSFQILLNLYRNHDRLAGPLKITLVFCNPVVPSNRNVSPFFVIGLGCVPLLQQANNVGGTIGGCHHRRRRRSNCWRVPHRCQRADIGF